MRVRIIFNLKNKGSYVPFHHQYLLAQLIKGIILKGKNPQYKDFSFYNFSGLKGQTKISRNGLHFYSSKVTLVFSCADQEFVNYFLKNLFELTQIEIGNLSLQPDSVELEQKPVLVEAMKYICISPIVLLTPNFYDDQGKKFINPETDQFSDLLYETTMNRMEQSGMFTAEQLTSFFKFQFVPDKDYLFKIKDTQKKFARIYPLYDQDVKYEIRGYTLPFTLYAAPEVQQFLFTHGMGLYAHKGFGMLDIANSDPSQRTTAYSFE
ncbi:CRISPR-associated endoribonuclease Cas6 [Cytophagales bacterium LB-30]|uniref:CRISPR-associated endoribonuclease Cas6 n=1 Tax=Shiella aurantiaca TaxID=3058365 RepID=A0ABT8F1M3_9BACT|nr:CRISPR-associated endoribonuclease Cas6 [Shiella aurantiaca]MDN4164254.1 CRISPR-associated endoribonuclease Cas6 [Shiella aurantiaca]